MIRFANVPATILLFVMALTNANASTPERLTFNKTVFTRAPDTNSQIAYMSQGNTGIVERIAFRSIDSNGKFDDVSRAFIERAKSESEGAELLVMENAKTSELVVAYLREIEPNKMLYKVERLSAPRSTSPVSVAYSSEFKVRNASEASDAKVKVTAMKAVATFSMDKARHLLMTKL